MFREGVSLLIFQPFDRYPDVDWDMLHFCKGVFPEIAAFQVNGSGHFHFIDETVLFRFGQVGFKSLEALFCLGDRTQLSTLEFPGSQRNAPVPEEL